MNFWVILLAAGMMSGLVVAAVLLWVGVNAILYGRGIARDAALTVDSLRRALRSIYDDTLHQSLPDDLRDLLGWLTAHGPRGRKTGVSGRLVSN